MRILHLLVVNPDGNSKQTTHTDFEDLMREVTTNPEPMFSFTVWAQDIKVKPAELEKGEEQ